MLTFGAGTASAGSGGPHIKIMQRRIYNEDTLNDVKYSVLSFLRQLENEGAIPGFTLEAPDTTLYWKYSDREFPQQDNCPSNWEETKYAEDEDKGDWFHSAQHAIKNDDNENADAYLFLTSNSNFASAEAGDDGNAWTDTSAFCWVGTKGDYDVTNDGKQRYKNLALQELGHTLVDHEEVFFLDENHGEHDLGMLDIEDYDALTGPVTPMATFYEQTDSDGDNNPCSDIDVATDQGLCNNREEARWNGNHTLEITACTAMAVEDSYDAYH